MNTKTILEFLCILFLLGCSSTQKSITQKPDINNAFEVYENLAEKLDKLNYNTERNIIMKLINRIDSLCSEEIKDSTKYDFDYLIEKIEKTKILENIFPSTVKKINNVNLEITVNEFRFRTLVAVQHNFERIYYQLPSKQKLSNAILFASTNSGISEVKTNLMNRQVELLSSLQDANTKLRCWAAIKRMLNEIDIKMSEKGDQVIQRSPYGIIITEGEIFKKLQLIADSENDENIKEYSKHTIEVIKSSGTKYKQCVREITFEDINDIFPNKPINEKALDFFNQAINSSGNKKKIELYSKAIEIDSSFTAAYCNRGISYFEDKSFQSAISDFYHVLKLDPNKVEVYSYIGNSYLKIKKYDSAIVNYSQAIKFGITEPSIYINRGFCYHESSNYLLAINDYTSAIKIDSTLVNAYTNRAQCYLSLEDYNSAVSDYKTLTVIDSMNSSHYYNLGCIYWKKKEWQKINDIWEKGLRINPVDENILKNLPILKKYLEDE